MKKSRFFSVLTLLSVLCVSVFCAALLNGSRVQFEVNAETPVIRMIDGASVRIPEATGSTDGDAYINDGLRFSSKIDKTTYDGWKNDYSLTTGTFIMPASYYNPDNAGESAFFGDSAIFYWKTAESDGTSVPVYNVIDRTGKKEIINVLSDVYLQNGETDKYTLNGSIMNLYDSSVRDGKFIGISYIIKEQADTTEYIVAETKISNARSVAEVAQAALLTYADANPDNDDPSLASVGARTALATDYVDKYISLYQEKYSVAPSATYTVKTFLESSSGYTKTESAIKTHELAAWDDVISVTPETVDGYGFDADNSNNVLSFIPRLDGKTSPEIYYNYNANRATIFDFEGETASQQWNNAVEYTAGQLSQFTEVIASDGNKIATGVVDVSDFDKVVIEGSRSLFVKNATNGGVAVTWANPLRLPFSTGMLKMDVHIPRQVATGNVSTYSYGNAQLQIGYVNSVGETKYTFFLPAVEELVAGQTMELSYLLEDRDGNAIEIDNVKYVSFGISNNVYSSYFADNLRAVKNFYLEKTNSSSAENVRSYLTKSTELFPDQIAESDIVFTGGYALDGSDVFTGLTATNGVANIDFSSAEIGKHYNISLTLTCNTETDTLNESFYKTAPTSTILLDFESEWANTDWGKTYNGVVGEHASVKRYQGNAVSGEYSLLINTTGEGRTWTKDSVGFDLSQYNSIGFWITCSTSGTLKVWFNGGYAEPSAGISIKQGTHYYVMDVSSISGNTNKIWFGNNNIEMYMDDLAFFNK